MNEYYKKIEELIVETEANKKSRTMIDNSETLLNYWQIGKLIIKAQGGETRAKYGSALIKKWSISDVKKYGKGYDYTNLSRMRKMYLLIPKQIVGTVSQLSWSHMVKLLPIKNKNERNYYINQVILNSLSIRELIDLKNNKAYDRLSYKDKESIELIANGNNQLTIEDMIKDPILINVDNNTKELNELALHKYIINMLENKFLVLGTGFTLAGHEYKINVGGITYRIDLLFFNVKLNSYIVVEVKTSGLKHSDISQLQFYVNYVDRNIKEKNHNKTIGILIVKKNNKYVIEYTTSNDIYVTTYELVSN